MNDHTTASDPCGDSTVFSSGPPEGVKGGKAGGCGVSNEEFIRAIFTEVALDAHVAVCVKAGDPQNGGWTARKAFSSFGSLLPTTNNYLSCSTFRANAKKQLRARKTQFSACHFFMLDDIGTKVELSKVGLELSWLIETSPGNHQGGIILKSPLADAKEADAILNAIIAAGLCDPGASGAQTRWVRLPVAINGKFEHQSDAGQAPACRLVQWNPSARYTPEEIVQGLGLVIASPSAQPSPGASGAAADDEDDVITPRARVNPVVTALKARGLYKSQLDSGKHDITCPWVSEHTDAVDHGSAYFEPDETYPLGGYCCQHSHRDKYKISALLTFLGVRAAEARHKPVIRILAGEINRVLDAAECELANLGHHYQAGGLIVSISIDPTSGDPIIVPTSAPALTRVLAHALTWEKIGNRSAQWVRTDPPARHVAILHESQKYRHLPPLKGLARQPYFRESDGELIMHPGYDKATQRYGAFEPSDFALPAPTLDAAKEALALLRKLLSEFHFVHPHDEAAALAAILTAAVRPTLDYAPAFHVQASVYGSGKTYLCDLIGAFAGPGANTKVSYPTTSEEATKVILSLLLTAPAVVEFDDMDGDWLPHGTIKRMLTASHITDRILGASRTATVSTQTVLLGSGNNVGPVRDLLRRVLTIHLNPRCATPATITYQGDPLARVRQNRAKYVCAALTIIQAYRSAGAPRMEAQTIASYSGHWSVYCRFPLIWLGLPDPATNLLDQIRHDPDGDALKTFLAAMHQEFGSEYVTVRKILAHTALNEELGDAMREFPIVERERVNPSKLGWFLKKHINRIVGNYELQRGYADGRVAWRVLLVDPTPPLPPLPASDCST